jgi:hypothetical protein
MALDRNEYTPFMDSVKEIFLEKMKKGKASKLMGWSARTMMDEVTEEQNLTELEQQITWAVLIQDMLGYTDHKIKELEDAWEKSRENTSLQSNSPNHKKAAQRSSTSL